MPHPPSGWSACTRHCAVSSRKIGQSTLYLVCELVFGFLLVAQDIERAVSAPVSLSLNLPRPDGNEQSEKCYDCPPGQRRSGDCSCVLCAVGTYSDSQSCFDCKDCALGNWVVDAPCTNSSDTKCGGCVEGYYRDPDSDYRHCIRSPTPSTGPDGNEQSRKCHDCPPGQRRSPTPGDCSCVPCAVGTYSTSTNSQSCFDCKDCALGKWVVVAPCTNSSNTKCGGCVEGYYRDPDSDFGNCTRSPTPSTGPDGNEQSEKCHDCPPGQRRSGDCSCVPCAVGTYSDSQSCFHCKDCALGNWVVDAPCTNSSNTKCGDCVEGYHRDPDSDFGNCITPRPSRVTHTSQPVTNRATREQGSSTAAGASNYDPDTSPTPSSTQQVPTEQQSMPSPSEGNSGPWDRIQDDSGNRTLIVAAIAAASSLLVVILVVAGIVKRCDILKGRNPKHGGVEPRTIPEIITTVGDLPDTMMLHIGHELVDSGNPGNYRNLLGELGADQLLVARLSLVAHTNHDDFSRELFRALQQEFEPPVTVLRLHNTLKDLGALTLACKILQLAKELQLKLEGFDDLDEAIEEALEECSRIVNEEGDELDTLSLNDPRPELGLETPNDLRHTSTSTLSDGSDD